MTSPWRQRPLLIGLLASLLGLTCTRYGYEVQQQPGVENDASGAPPGDAASILPGRDVAAGEAGGACAGDACLDLSLDRCAAGCDDGDACTADSCDAAEGCVNTPICTCSTFDVPATSRYTVPAGIAAVSVKCWGAGGGNGQGNAVGGAGGFAAATLSVTAGEELVIVTGAPGSDASGLLGGAGGVPGGGDGADGENLFIGRDGSGGGGGGGYSGVFRGTALRAGVLAAAGGGAGSGGSRGVPSRSVAGAGGGVSGEDSAGDGGTQTAAGCGPLPTQPVTCGGPLLGGSGTRLRVDGNDGNDAGGGGGAGYFGGGGGSGASGDAFGGGGGSGFVTGSDTTLLTGAGTTPANAEDADRGTAGGQGQPGRVIVCPLARTP